MDEQEERVQVAQGEVADRRVGLRGLDEAVAMDPGQWQAHLIADDIQVGLELTLAEGELICELFSREAGMVRDVLNDGPDPLESIRDESLTVQAMLLIERRESGCSCLGEDQYKRPKSVGRGTIWCRRKLGRGRLVTRADEADLAE